MARKLKNYSSEEITEVLSKFLDIPLVENHYKNSYEVMGKFPQLNYTRRPEEMEFETNFEWLIPVKQKLFSIGILVEYKENPSKVIDNGINYLFKLSDGVIFGETVLSKFTQRSANDFTHIILTRKLV